jgi:diacylglycerol kinase (ATP)
MSRTLVILNPNSGRGRGARLEPAIRQAFQAQGAEFGSTQGPGDEERLAREAIAAGFERIVAVGGDGTTSNVAHAIVESGKRVALGLVPGGTGCDLARTLDIPQNDLTRCASIVAAGKTQSIDVGKLEGRCFVNVAGFGFDIAVLDRASRVKWLKGELLYLFCALLEMKAYPGFALKSDLDGTTGPSGTHMMVIVANARKFGGGFHIAPDASLEDGRLDVVSFGELGFGARLEAMGALMKGQHAALPNIGIRPASRMTFEFDHPPGFETDGERRQAATSRITIETLPKALSVLVP